jgi:hypothetical protein
MIYSTEIPVNLFLGLQLTRGIHLLIISFYLFKWDYWKKIFNRKPLKGMGK